MPRSGIAYSLQGIARGSGEMTRQKALAMLKTENAILASGVLGDDTLQIILDQYASTSADGTIIYDIGGAAIKALKSLVGSIPKSRTIGGISYTNESITTAIEALQAGRCGMADFYHEHPDELIESDDAE